MREKMAKIGLPTERGYITVDVPLDLIPMHKLTNALQDKQRRLEWDAEQTLRKAEEVKRLLDLIAQTPQIAKY